MSKQVDLIIASLKDRPEEWNMFPDKHIFSDKYSIWWYGFSKTEFHIAAYHINLQRDQTGIFLSYQNKWILERAVSEWLKKHKK